MPAVDAPVAPLAGSLADFPVDQVLQLIGSGGRTGTFTVAGALPLEVVVDDGRLGGARGDVLDHDGLVQVLFHLLLVGGGDFTFAPGDVDVAGPRWPLAEVLADVTDRVARWRAISEVLPSLDVVVRLVPVDAGDRVELSASSWNVAAALDGSRRARDVTLLLGGDAFATMEVVHDLVTRGLAAVVPDQPPA